ncbi:hypothetical protein [Dinghuibacter silviterrae]|uniref:Uncharacterized protein n=1 Tax=Dinghuibacter silviterrae TaxID=1539049 RepID=A0A4R8DQU4_9BACT|nr:hypothetical protein [Dinghuibacter silviterrae]TDX00319.1 hypothetical protein EDB95_1340 [Dinghuibacter silviterrae]
MKTTFLTRCVMALMIAGVGFYSCTKSNTGNNSSSGATSTTGLQVAADDQSQVSYESDAVSDDANTALNGETTVSGSITEHGTGTITTMGINQEDSVGAGGGVIVNNNIICDASVSYADTNGARTITITYNGANCAGNRTRTGQVIISIPNGVYWKDPAAAVTVRVVNLTITRIRDGKVIVINGTKTYTNVTGGLLVDLPNTDSIVHTITGSMEITFGNGNVRSWSVSKRRVFTYNNGIYLSTTGTHSDSLNHTDVAEWGVNRFGVSFESLITEPKTIAQSCEFRLTGGQNEVLRSDGWTSTITYGLDASGDATGCPGTGTYYYKLVVTRPNGLTYTYILPY